MHLSLFLSFAVSVILGKFSKDNRFVGFVLIEFHYLHSNLFQLFPKTFKNILVVKKVQFNKS